MGRVLDRNYVRNNIMSWNPDHYGPIYLGQSNYGTSIYALPSTIERAGGIEAYVNHVNVMFLAADAMTRVGGHQNVLAFNKVEGGLLTQSLMITMTPQSLASNTSYIGLTSEDQWSMLFGLQVDFWGLNQSKPVESWHVLHRSTRTDIFGHRIVFQYETKTVKVSTVVIMDFNSSGKKVENVRGFRIVNTTIGSKNTNEWKSLPRDRNGKLILPDGMHEYIMMLAFHRGEKTVWDKYWDFVLSPSDAKGPFGKRKLNRNIVTGRHN
jgi:hypothetical protein